MITGSARIVTGLPGAFVVTLLIFLLLATVISQQQDVVLTDDRSVQIKVTRQLDDRSDQNADDFERPVLDQPPPPPPMVSDPTFRPSMTVQMGALPDMGADLNIGSGFNPDRDAQPLVRIPPQYPQRCQRAAGVLETVVVEFNVTPEGNVVSPTVVSATNACFNQAAMRAVTRWRYQPRVVDGVAQSRFGVRTAIDFRMEE